MTSQSSKATEQAIWLRPTRWYIAIFGGGAAGVLAVIVVRSVIEGQVIAAVMIWVGLLMAVFVVIVNYTWFHYVTIDDEKLRQVKYFGLIRRDVRIVELEHIGTRPMNTSFGLMAPEPSVRFYSRHGVIELGNTYYSSSIRRAVTFLREKGIPVDAKLLKALKIDRSPRENSSARPQSTDGG